MVSGSGRSARRAGHRSRLGTLGVALLPLLLVALPRAAHADVTCRDGVCTMDRARAEQCAADAVLVLDQAHELRLRLRDVHELQGLVDRTAARLDVASRALARERARLPAWAWWVAGVGTGVVVTVAAIVAGLLLAN